MTQETEIKLRIDSAPNAAELLAAQGFAVTAPRIFERNLVFDTRAQDLRKSQRLLRLRQAGELATLTYKGPPEPGRHKSREERETRVTNFVEMQVVLERLGYEVTFVYEKHRTEYAVPNAAGVATIDETPVGVFIELEGPAEWIDTTAAALGFSEKDYITASYGTLYAGAKR